MIHLLIPMSGQGTRYQQAGYSEPKPLITVSGAPMIERLLENFPAAWPAHFVLAENHRDTALPALLKKLRPQGRLSFIAPHRLGPGHSALAALQNIPENEPVFLSYCDYGMVWDSAQFERFARESACDACVVSYRGFHAHYLGATQYAYSRLEGERVVEVREKASFTDNRENEFASSGGYYFRTAKILLEAIAFQIAQGMELGGEYYSSLTVEALLRMNPRADVRVFEVPGFFQWGTPRDLQRFEYWENSYRAYNRCARERNRVAQVLMPMAGLGSRFAGISSRPKPLIAIDGIPLFRRALDSLPLGDAHTVVALESFSNDLRPHLPKNTRVVALPSTPKGQALSTEAGVPGLDPAREVFVSACDHAVAIDPGKWSRFHGSPDCDAAIFTIRGFPEVDDKPKSFSYVVAEGTGEFPEVERISVKIPVSERPSRDQLLVGTFWFRSAELLQRGIDALKQSAPLVNGELYLDSIFTEFVKMGLKVRAFPLDGYIGWGDPQSLAEALYWQERFSGRGISVRPRFPGVE